MYNSTPNSLIVGKKVIYLPSCHSTNDIASEIVHAGLFEEGTVVITDNQVGGRGQRGTKWVATPGENLTFSFILTPTFLPIADQFLISQLTAMAVRAYLSDYLNNVKIKWPNDVYAGRKKVCGILIENAIQGSVLSHSIVGVGVNINQLNFAGNTTSLGAETGQAYVLSDEFQKLTGYLDAHFVRLRSAANHNHIRAEYLSQLYGYDTAFKFSYNNQIFKGNVADVTREGRLRIRISNPDEEIEVGLKEIEWLFD